jgi:hypothetical protein
MLLQLNWDYFFTTASYIEVLALGSECLSFKTDADESQGKSLNPSL